MQSNRTDVKENRDLQSRTEVLTTESLDPLGLSPKTDGSWLPWDYRMTLISERPPTLPSGTSSDQYVTPPVNNGLALSSSYLYVNLSSPIHLQEAFSDHPWWMELGTPPLLFYGSLCIEYQIMYHTVLGVLNYWFACLCPWRWGLCVLSWNP